MAIVRIKYFQQQQQQQQELCVEQEVTISLPTTPQSAVPSVPAVSRGKVQRPSPDSDDGYQPVLGRKALPIHRVAATEPIPLELSGTFSALSQVNLDDASADPPSNPKVQPHRRQAEFDQQVAWIQEESKREREKLSELVRRRERKDNGRRGSH